MIFCIAPDCKVYDCERHHIRLKDERPTGIVNLMDCRAECREYFSQESSDGTGKKAETE